MRARTALRRLVGGAVVAMVAVPTLLGRATASHAQEPQDRFRIAGEVDGLYPGAELTLEARVTNPYRFPIVVTTLGATVGEAAPGCPASMLEVRTSDVEVEVPAGAVRSVPLRVRMDRGAPDACQGVTWPLQFRGTATETETAAAAPGSGDAGPDAFAYTGLDLLVLIVTAVSLAAAGVVALHQARRRRREAASS